MHTFCGATVAVILTIAIAAGAVAQSDDFSAEYTHFTGKIVEEGFHQGDEENWVADGAYHSRGIVAEWTIEWTDPRLPSTMWHRLDYEGYGWDQPDGGATPYATSVLLEGEDGSWVGTGRGVGYDEGFVQVSLVGEGDYEGLYAILDRKDATLPDGTAQRTFDGFIFEGALTPMPDPVRPVVTE